MSEKLLINQVIFKPIPTLENGELSDKIIRKCHFCGKKCEFSENSSHLSQKLSGNDCFYCLFCLRHNLNNKNNKNILILSFRNIIGFLYHQNYVAIRKLWLSEIEDYIDSHVEVGLQNPLFLYDPETMLWFIDFNKVGKSKRKIPVEEVFKTVIGILSCFNLSENIINIRMGSLYQKYQDGIEMFYRNRQRLDGILVPLLFVAESNFDDRTKNFIFQDLKLKK